MHRALLSPEWLALPLAALGFSIVAFSWFIVKPRVAAGKVIPPPPEPSRPQALSGTRHLLMVSWYGEEHRGRRTASGAPFDPDALTAAHPYLPFGTRLRLRLNSATVDVTVNDRGPFIAERDLDISYGAAKRLDMTHAGVAFVDVEVLP